MPYNAPVPRELAREIRTAAAVARLRVRWHKYGFTNNVRKRDEQQKKLIKGTLDSLSGAQRLRVTRKKLLKLIDRAALDEINYQHSRENVLCLLRMLKGEPDRWVISFEEVPVLRRAVLAAVKHDDLDFFVSLGRTLSQKPGPRHLKGATALEEFLIEHWCEPEDGVPALFNLSIKALCAECKSRLPAGASLTPHVTEKTRQRLGLISWRPSAAKKAGVRGPSAARKA